MNTLKDHSIYRSNVPFFVMPPAGEEAGEGAFPGWLQPLAALLTFADPTEQVSSVSMSKEDEGFSDISSGGKVPCVLLLLLLLLLLLRQLQLLLLLLLVVLVMFMRCLPWPQAV